MTTETSAPLPDVDREQICFTLTSTGDAINVGWARHDDSIGNSPTTPNGIAYFDRTGFPIDPTADGFTVVPCSGESGPDFEQSIVCVQETIGGFQITTPAIRHVVRAADGTETVTFLSNGANGETVDITGQVEAWSVGDCFPPDRLVLCDANGEPFIQTWVHPTDDTPLGIEYFGLNGIPIAQPPEPYQLCGAESVEAEIVEMCDANNVSFLRHFFYADDGTVTTVDTDPAGSAFAPVAPMRIGRCDLGRSQAHVLNIIGNGSWTPADVPPGQVLESVTMTVLSGLGSVIDFDGGQTLVDLPTGVTLSWTAADDQPLDGPQVISVQDPASRVVVNFVTRGA